jgi:hypothetical protein
LTPSADAPSFFAPDLDVVRVRLLEVCHHARRARRTPDGGAAHFVRGTSNQPVSHKSGTDHVVGVQVREEHAADLLPANAELREALQRTTTASKTNFLSPASTNVLGPKRFMTAGGQTGAEQRHLDLLACCRARAESRERKCC